MKNKTALIIIIVGVVLALGIVLLGSKNNSTAPKSSSNSIVNSQIKDGIQYVTINAKGGYSPRISTAKAGVPTKLIVKTNGTYDCSAALIVRQANFQKILQRTGEETIDLGTPQAGIPIRGTCGMGMYSFQINFE